MRVIHGKRNKVRQRRGFTIVEALTAITITAIAGSALLVAVESSIGVTQDSVDTTIADGIAQQMIDEVLGKRYKAVSVGPYQYPLSPSGWEASGYGRERFDDTDDFNKFQAQPAEGIYGELLGTGDGYGGKRHPNFVAPSTFFDRWGQKIEVYYVDEDDPSQKLLPGQTSNLRSVEVTIFKIQLNGAKRDLATARRVYAYVPPP